MHDSSHFTSAGEWRVEVSQGSKLQTCIDLQSVIRHWVFALQTVLRPAFNRLGEQIEDSIAKVRFVRSRSVWQLFWMRADLKWHRYPPCPETASLSEALHVIHQDTNGCFFG
ncbi:MAG: DUF3024 domain-containing protein [Verrucomicrobiaceae bacterium]|nr:DUF3024 domain-containing protein [Verrucomicrobiaceae bacterium]